MFSTIRIAAGVAVLALVGTFAYVAIPVTQGPIVPGAETQAIDPADFGGFSGTMSCNQGDWGALTTTDFGSHTEGETYARCRIEASDPRFSGNNYSVHDYYKYAGQPQWGVRSNSSVITNEHGTWVGEQGWGYQHPEHGALRYTGLYHGTGDYEGLTALLLLSQDEFGLTFDVEGVILPGDLPPVPAAAVEEALAVQERLAVGAD
jgi:hypothetical protein